MESIVLTAIAALVSAYIGANLALRKFKYEQHWKEKYDAYKEIFDALGNLLLWADETYSSCKLLPSIGAKEGPGFYKGYAHARVCLTKFSTSGRFIVKGTFSDELQELSNQLWQSEFVYDDALGDPALYDEELASHAEKVRELVQSRLEKLVTLAKSDLK